MSSILFKSLYFATMYKYIVFLSDDELKKYRITCEDKHCIREKVEAILNLKNRPYYCESFDPDFNDYYTVVSDQDFPDIGKISLSNFPANLVSIYILLWITISY